MNEPIDNPDLQPVQQSQALVKPDMTLSAVDKVLMNSLTPAQARVEAVANVLHKAYERASTLELTQEQIKALKSDFPPEAFKQGAGGNPDLIYIEHAFLRDRFDEVIGMGQWCLVRSRPHWGEEYVTGKGQKAVRIYADCALLIKGCLVAEAIGEMTYYPNNALQSYGDAAEGSETAAFRRCAKKIGVGLQAWKKDFCEAWMKAKHNPKAKTYPVQSPTPKAAPKQKVTFDFWLEACRNKLLDLCKPVLPHAWIYAVREGWILPTEQLTAVTASKMFPGLVVGPDESMSIQASKDAVAKRHAEIMAGIQAIADGPRDEEMMQQFSAAYVASEPDPEPDVHVPRDLDPEPSEDEWWREVEIHFGKNQGTALGDMEKNTLWGWWSNWHPKEYKGQISAQDKRLREALDAAGEHYQFKS